MVLLIALTPHVRAEDNLYFHGELVAEPCVIPPGSEVIPLDFGTVIDKYLYSYQRTLPVPLAIQLAECDLSLGQSLTLTFVGSENGSLPGYLALAPAARPEALPSVWKAWRKSSTAESAGRKRSHW